MPTLHARDCICTICTCGKHECDIPRKKPKKLAFDARTANQDAFKPGATSNAKRSRAARPKDHDVFGTGNLKGAQTEAQEAWVKKERPAKEKPLFEPKMRTRPRVKLDDQTTTRAANDQVAKGSGRRASQARPRDNITIDPAAKFNTSSENQSSYKKGQTDPSKNRPSNPEEKFLASLAKRPTRATRPKVPFAKETTSNVAYAKAPDRAARARAAKPRDHLGADKHKFTGKSAAQEAFNADVAKAGLDERARDQKARRDAVRLKSRPKVAFENKTSNNDYRDLSSKSRQEARREKIRPSTTVGDAVRPQQDAGTRAEAFKSEAASAFVPNSLPPKRPMPTMARRPRVPFQAETTSKAAFKQPTSQQASDAKARNDHRPRSAMDKPQGKMAGRNDTVNNAAYTRPPSCPVPKLPAKPASANTGHTRYQRSDSRGWH